ncbi:MAG TPA: caspase family protein [Anaerolineae bacterium]|nr:caspase family protein [Anaerolineae bacterium]
MKKDDSKAFIPLISVIFLVGMMMSGCASMMGASGHMANSLNYVRQHKGEGLRRPMAGSEAELMDMAVKSMEKANYTIIREPHAVLAKYKAGTDISYAFYFYPSQMNNQTYVEVLIASPWLTAKQMRKFQEQAFTIILVDINKKLLEKGYDPNVKVEGSWLPLSTAAFDGQIETAKKLINKGADLDLAIYELKEFASKQSPYLSYPDNRKAYDKANLAVEMLNRFTPRQIVQQTNVSQNITKEDLANIVKSVVEDAKKSQNKDIKTASAVQSDIDKPFFSTASKIMGDNDYAIIIGIEGYSSLPKSDYSYDDAMLVKDYIKALGVKERNIELLTDEKATLSGIMKSIEAWLPNKLKKGGKVFVYYSGHGSPNPVTGEAFIVPHDGDPNYLDVTGYPLKRLYEKLGRLQASEIIVVLDSCFSGAGGRSVLAKGARPLVMTSQSAILPQNMVVLSATQGSQISTSFQEKGYGIFTYYFLKALKDGKKSVAEIYEHIKPYVEDEAKSINVQQSPSINPNLDKLKGSFLLRK